MGSMRRDQAANGTFRQIVGIDSVEKYVEVVGIGRQAGKGSILPTLIPRDGGLGVFFDRAIMAGQQGIELLTPRFSIVRYKRVGNLSYVGQDLLVGGIPLRRDRTSTLYSTAC